MKLKLILLLFVQYRRSIIFDLNASKIKQCFLLRGQNVGKEIKLSYSIIGNSTENVKFSIVDMESRDRVVNIKNHKNKNS